jgi:ribosomal protein S18 acetylase RimI-like enzyme
MCFLFSRQIRHTSHVTRHTSHVTRHTSHVTRHTSHVTRHTSHVTRHTSHVTRHTSHVTRHTSHVTRHTSRAPSPKFYLGYMSRWPEYFTLAEDGSKRPLAYIIGNPQDLKPLSCFSAAFNRTTGKAEEFANQKNSLHGHVTALTGPFTPPASQPPTPHSCPVSPNARRMGLAERLMGELESVSERVHNGGPPHTLDPPSSPFLLLPSSPPRLVAPSGFFVDLFVRASNALAIGAPPALALCVPAS